MKKNLSYGIILVVMTVESKKEVLPGFEPGSLVTFKSDGFKNQSARPLHYRTNFSNGNPYIEF